MNNDYKSVLKKIDETIKPDKSFDIIKRELLIGGRNSVLYFIDGFIKDEVFEKMLEYLFKQTPEDMAKISDMERFALDKMPYVEVDYTFDIDAVINNILSGPAVLIVEGIEGALLIDTRTYPTRSIEEPQKDKSLRGSRDGFVETLIFNTAMIRRRIRTPELRMEYLTVGENSKVDISVSYIEGLADKKTLDIIKQKLAEVSVKGISMTSQALAEALMPRKFFNPLPKFKFTERPDFASAAILDGKIVVVMDNSPSVMILPDSFADFFREADDYYFLPVIASYTRILRMIVSILTVILTPLYLLFLNNPQFIPEWLSFIKADDIGKVPLLAQLLILEFIVDGLRLASLNTPETLSNALGIIGGLLLSEFAIDAGWFIGETILFMAFVTIASYSQPSFEIGYAMKFERIILLILTQLFSYWGLIAGVVFGVTIMAFNRTLSGKSFLYPIIPFNLKAFKGLFVRPAIKR